MDNFRKELMPIFKSSQFLWLLSIPFTYLIFFSLWGVGILESQLFLNPNPLFFMLSYLHYPIAIYLGYALWCHQEDRMNQLFLRTIWASIIGIILWFFILSGIAY
jgi:hypothetical protein